MSEDEGNVHRLDGCINPPLYFGVKLELNLVYLQIIFFKNLQLTIRGNVAKTEGVKCSFLF